MIVKIQPQLSLKIKVTQNGTVVSSNPLTVASVPVSAPSTAPTRLDLLDDVTEITPSNNNTLVYDQATDKYVVKEIPELNGGEF